MVFHSVYTCLVRKVQCKYNSISMVSRQNCIHRGLFYQQRECILRRLSGCYPVLLKILYVSLNALLALPVAGYISAFKCMIIHEVWVLVYVLYSRNSQETLTGFILHTHSN